MDGHEPMKIFFVVPGLPPGRDGVGDQTRRIGEAMARLEAAEPVYVPWREVRPGQFPLSGDEWVSVQVVPYAFHPKGIMSDQGRILRRSFGGRRMHVMFHELWLGDGWDDSWKARFYGHWQRRGVLKFLRDLGPDVVTTSNAIYQELLREQGIPAHVLPLTGNIPLYSGPGEAAGPARDAAEWKRRHPEGWSFVFFGAFQPEWRPEDFFPRVKAEAGDRPCLFISAGDTRGGEERWKEWSLRYREGGEFRFTGMLAPEELSRLFLAADFGITMTPLDLVGKSSAVSSLREHGLPVLVTRPATRWRRNLEKKVACPPGLYAYTKASGVRLEQIGKTAPKDSADERARTLYALMQ
jgi:glycosyltransferase involved in cell wall biosynthesis